VNINVLAYNLHYPPLEFNTFLPYFFIHLDFLPLALCVFILLFSLLFQIVNLDL
jgi:hypothetical protein